MTIISDDDDVVRVSGSLFSVSLCVCDMKYSRPNARGMCELEKEIEKENE